MIKTLVIFVLFTAQIYCQWRGATNDYSKPWVKTLPGVSYSAISSSFTVRNDTTFIGFNGSGSDDTRINAMTPIEGIDGEYKIGATGSIDVNAFNVYSNTFQISGKIFFGVTGSNGRFVFKYDSPPVDISSTVTSPEGLMRTVSTHNDTVYGGFSTRSLFRYTTNSAGDSIFTTSILDYGVTHSVSSSFEIHDISFINDTIWLSLGDAIAWNVYPDTVAANVGVIGYYSLTDYTSDVLSDTIASAGKLRWISKVIEAGGNHYVMGQGVYPTQGIYQRNGSSWTKISTPNDSISYPMDIESVEDTLYLTTSGATNDSTNNRVFKYDVNGDAWTVLPFINPPGASTQYVSPYLLNHVGGNLQLVLATSDAGRQSYVGTSTANDDGIYFTGTYNYMIWRPDSLIPSTNITGTGTLGDPYVLYNYVDLRDSLSVLSSTAYYEFGDDIDFQYYPFTSMPNFEGSQRKIDGKGYKLKNITVTDTLSSTDIFYGVFETFASGGKLSNLVIDSVDVTTVINGATNTNDFYYALIGNSDHLDSIIVKNTVLGLDVNDDPDNIYAGILSANPDDTTQNCIVDNSVLYITKDTTSGSTHYAGAFAGYTSSSTAMFNNSVRDSYISVTDSTSDTWYIGAFLGQVSVTNNHNNFVRETGVQPRSDGTNLRVGAYGGIITGSGLDTSYVSAYIDTSQYQGGGQIYGDMFWAIDPVTSDIVECYMDTSFSQWLGITGAGDGDSYPTAPNYVPTDSLRQQTNFTNWNFTSTWEMSVAAENDEMPVQRVFGDFAFFSWNSPTEWTIYTEGGTIPLNWSSNDSTFQIEYYYTSNSRRCR